MFKVNSKKKRRTSKDPRKVSVSVDGGIPATPNPSTRFTLPSDMRELEKMTPREYLFKYCILSSLKEYVCTNTFYKLKEPKSATITCKDLEKGISDSIVNIVTADNVDDICDLLDIDDEEPIDFKLFCGITAFTERVVFRKFYNQKAIDLPQNHRGYIEAADFHALKWKLKTVKINPLLKKVLDSLNHQ